MEVTATLSQLRVEIAGRVATIQGTMLNDGFLAYSDTIRYWEPPYESIKIDERIKTEFIRCLVKETENSNFKIIFTREFN